MSISFFLSTGDAFGKFVCIIGKGIGMLTTLTIILIYFPRKEFVNERNMLHNWDKRIPRNIKSDLSFYNDSSNDIKLGRGRKGKIKGIEFKV